MKKTIRFSIYFTFLVYLFMTIYFTLMDRDVQSTMKYELQLFWSYKEVICQHSFRYWKEIILNILLFAPLGIYVPLIFRSFRNILRVVAISFCSSLFIELTQLLFRIGLFEFDDIFNNVLGAIIGFGIFYCYKSCFERKRHWIFHSILGIIPLLATTLYFSFLLAHIKQNL